MHACPAAARLEELMASGKVKLLESGKQDQFGSKMVAWMKKAAAERQAAGLKLCSVTNPKL